MTESLSIENDFAAKMSVKRALTLMTALQILGTSCVLALTALAPVVALDLGIGAHWIGYQISLIYFSGMFASAFAGAIIAALGTRRVVLLETALFGIGLLLLASGQLWFMGIGSALLGVAYGLNNPASSEILDYVTPRVRRNLVFSVKQSGVPIGAIVANIAFPALVVLLSGSWQLALLLSTLVVGVTLASLWTFLLTPGRLRQKVTAKDVFATLLSDQRYILGRSDQRALATLGGLYSAAQLMVTAFVVVTLVEQGWSPVNAGMVGATMHLLGAIGRIAWGVVADWLGCFRVLSLIGGVIAILSFALIWLGAAPAALQATIFIVLGFVVSGWNGVMLAGVAQTAPAGRVSSNTGAALVYTFVGVIIGPSIFAVVYSYLGTYAACFGLVTLLGLAGAIVAERSAPIVNQPSDV